MRWIRTSPVKNGGEKIVFGFSLVMSEYKNYGFFVYK